MKPGESVASPRSMTCAPWGIARLLPASTILSPWTITTPFVTRVFDLPSNRRAAFSAIVGAGSTARAITAENAESAEKRRRRFFIGFEYEIEERKASFRAKAVRLTTG